MDGNGIMQEVRGLLTQGLSVPEIIGQGYAPSTVYRVQRDNRRKLGIPVDARHGGGTSTRGLEYWVHLVTETQRLNQRLDSLERQLTAVAEAATAGPLWDRVAELQRTLEDIATCQKQMLRELDEEKAMIGKFNSELDDLAQLFKDELWLGVGEPRWRRRS